MYSRLVLHLVLEDLAWENYIEILATLPENY